MTFSELRQSYTQIDLCAFPGNGELRQRIFAPFFDQLYENKVVYLEKFMGIVKLSDIRITRKGFAARATPYLTIKRSSFSPSPPSRSWEFGCPWSWLCLWKNSFSVSYAGWTVWPEYARVKAVEDAVLADDHEHALALTRSEPEVEYAQTSPHS